MHAAIEHYYFAVILGGIALSLFSFWLWLALIHFEEPRRRATGRARRRGGYIRPAASPRMRAVETYTIAGTRSTVVSFSSPGAPGDQRAGSGILRTRLELSSSGALGSSTDATVEAGANGAQRPSAA